MNMKQLLFILLTICVFTVSAQHGKKHIVHDTTITQHEEYSPDTIAVWFKELRVKIVNINRDSLKMKPFIDTSIVEGWTKGFVIWQTKKPGFIFSGGTTATGTLVNYPEGTISSSSFQQGYYDDKFEPTKFSDNKFLYADRKTRVTNKVLYTILR